jgi:hypothetical protein
MTKGKKISDLIVPKSELQKMNELAEDTRHWGDEWKDMVNKKMATAQSVTIKSPLSLKNIKDPILMEETYYHYLHSDMDSLCRNIELYGDFIFFHDLIIYLAYGYRVKRYRKQAYEEIVNIYLNQYTPNGTEIEKVI